MSKQKGISKLQKTAIDIYYSDPKISKKEAMRRAGYKHSTANIPQHLFNSPHTQDYIEEIKAKARAVFSPDTIIQGIKEGTEANYQLTDKFGHIIAERPDHKTRHKYWETAREMVGEKKAENTGNNFYMNFIKSAYSEINQGDNRRIDL